LENILETEKMTWGHPGSSGSLRTSWNAGELHGMLENILETEEGKTYKDLSPTLVDSFFSLQTSDS
jgi:hypothetical protein